MFVGADVKGEEAVAVDVEAVGGEGVEGAGVG